MEKLKIQEENSECRENPRIFYHVSPAKLKAGDVLEVGKKGEVCLATSIEQAIYWASVLFGKNIEKRRADVKDCTIYKVEIIDADAMVEDCVGHYSFEHSGEMKKPSDIKIHTEDLDGEVVVRSSPVVVVGSVDVDLAKETDILEKKQLEEIRRLMRK